MSVSTQNNGQPDIFTVSLPSEKESASSNQTTTESNRRHSINVDPIYSSDLLTDNLLKFKCIEESRYEVVAQNVPIITDDKMQYLTFRTIVLGLLLTVIMAIMNTIFSFRRFPLSLDVIIFQLISMPIGRFMASILPKSPIKIFKWNILLNPGPFTIKEHALVTAMVAVNAGTNYAIYQVTALNRYYSRPLPIVTGLFLVLTTSMTGYGMAGKYSL
ncbi:unnamed protein product [Didymodactylos carnosus]|uniref:Uncharacterized protein n=1 Tax=Didymodactylos carnosus TaxID=1234261 RepID=A0A815Z1U1_9BILA|nr:unnamed protein product [Didymodactylos carnosus]CAF4443417.1 unnamed protein product [Didymodactylos carnosus]